MKKVFYAILAVVLGAAAVLYFQPRPVEVEFSTVSRGLFEETFTVEGRIRARTKQTLYAFASGNIEEVRVKLGDRVVKNQVITRVHWDYDRWVESPFDGVVSKLYRESAGPVVRGEPIVEITALFDLEIVVDVLTNDALRLHPGGKARLINWGIDRVINAEIIAVSRAASVKISALGVEEERTEVRLRFLNVPASLLARLGDFYHVDVMFEVSREERVLKIPLGALFRDGESWAVYVLKGDRVHRRHVLVSKKNDEEAMVQEGLLEGELVVLFPGDQIREGLQVTPKGQR